MEKVISWEKQKVSLMYGDRKKMVIPMPDQTTPVPVCPWSACIYGYIITWQVKVNWDETEGD